MRSTKLFDNEYQGIHNGDVMVKVYLNMVNNLVASIRRSGLKVINTNISNHLLSAAIILTIIEYKHSALLNWDISHQHWRI